MKAPRPRRRYELEQVGPSLALDARGDPLPIRYRKVRVADSPLRPDERQRRRAG